MSCRSRRTARAPPVSPRPTWQRPDHEQGLGRHDRQGRGEQGAQASGAGHMVPPANEVALAHRRAGRERVHQRAGPVPIEAAVKNEGQRVLRERVGLVPVVAHGGHQAALDEQDREKRHGTGVGGDVERVRQQRVGTVEIALEQMGDAFGVQHRRPGTGLAGPSPSMASWASRRICAIRDGTATPADRRASPPSCSRPEASPLRVPAQRRSPSVPRRRACRSTP